jgi:SET domain-containing protein
MVIEYTGERLRKNMDRSRIDSRYLLSSSLWFIDGANGGDDSRFINHLCQPNLDVEEWDVNGELRIVLIADEDIVEDSELTFFYNRVGKETCHCGSGNCFGSFSKSRQDKGAKLNVWLYQREIVH